MLKFCLKHFSLLPLLLSLLLSHSLRVLCQQVQFSLPLDLDKNKYFTLKQVLHHGEIPNSGKNLFRKLEIKQSQNLVFEEFSYTGSGPSGEYIVNFLEETRASGFGVNDVEREIPIPNHKNVDTVLSFAKMSYNAYLNPSAPDQWIDLENTNYEKLPFGWEEIGLRGYVFSEPDNSTVIIAFKGTSVKYIYDDDETAPRDKYNDNLMFSCCCAKIDFTWRGICDCKRGRWRCDSQCVKRESMRSDSYFEAGLRIYDQVKKDFPNSKIWLTGHSLGGSIASLIALKYDLPAFAFQTPGELLYAERIGLKVHNSSAANIFHFGHTADPIFTGNCVGVSACYAWGFAMETKCHLGKSCVYDTRSRLGWKSNIKHHGLLEFIEEVIKEWPIITEGKEKVANCKREKECVDCGRWKFD